MLAVETFHPNGTMNFSTDAMGHSSSQTPPRFPGQIFLWIAVSIFALGYLISYLTCGL